ncbi:AraC family transcriptional regulator [Gracilibacillus alcaliphilus]|uniref:AraC family transcriptional regulator n=1 Tax=Gracilibacillus alcaliphilus TaxID=1401441 RepID=UPI00195A4F2F|nr:helix-turn-helix domain-containing protein [Gracilibacillus alcaliphilus]MBM7677718.1 AraC-like DNA-binding protein/mannose-6-phosphate isomerase-like protein (cupin superfamily) [Gracilibacillus alcaliphilus]
MNILIENATINQGNHYLNQHIHYVTSEKMNIYLHHWGGGAFLQHDFLSNHYEVYYILNGEGTFIFNKQEYPIIAGDLFLLKPNAACQLKDKSDLTMLFFTFEPYSLIETKELMEFFDRIEDIEHFEYFLLNNQFNTGVLWQEMLIQSNQQSLFTPEIVKPLACTLITIIIQNFYQQIMGFESIDLKDSKVLEPNAIIYNAKLFINDNLDKHLKLSDVADHLHVSHRHLSRLFTQHIDVTFTQYVRSEKINKAAILLATTDLPIKIVAQKVGFDTVHYFSSVFKKVMDIPPGEFRTRLQSD